MGPRGWQPHSVHRSVGDVAWAVVVLLGVRLSEALRRDRVRRRWDRVTGTVLAGVGGGLVASRG
ncbi:hypothetical protein J4G33_12040 [Actinotalea sp. BY-33]|uniref:Uncharacterized protein n=1 Tax=Actinotalea soli TaxID=2819234 RepID=A0A939LR77_9CELL|nr:hypothetical protein [Actinotalea soli]MBO1752533.1 hypothetical protein [Actinotalea soli]